MLGMQDNMSMSQVRFNAMCAMRELVPDLLTRTGKLQPGCRLLLAALPDLLLTLKAYHAQSHAKPLRDFEESRKHPSSAESPNTKEIQG